MKSLKLVFDCDNTLSLTDEAILELYRLRTGDCSTTLEHNHNQWDYDDLCPLWDRKAQADAFLDLKLFEFLKPKPGAVEVLKVLKEQGHEIVVCTVHDARAVQAKIEWINRHFPFIDATYIISNNECSMNKSFISGDIIFDDNVNCLITSDTFMKVCFGEYPWNRNWEELAAQFYWKRARATDFREVYYIVQEEASGAGVPFWWPDASEKWDDVPDKRSDVNVAAAF